MTWKIYGSAWKCIDRSIMTEWERQDMYNNACSVYDLNCVFCARRFSSSWTEGSLVSFASEGRWQSRGDVTWFDGIVNNPVTVVVWWKVETLPRGNGWKLMTTGGVVVQQRRKCLILAPLQYPQPKRTNSQSHCLKKLPELISEITIRFNKHDPEMALYITCKHKQLCSII